MDWQQAAAWAAGLAGGLAAAMPLSASASEWFPYPVEVWEKPFDMEGPRHFADYRPQDKAGKPWRICATIPHLKDNYWLAVAYGFEQEAERQGVRLQLHEAGGYDNLARQIAQIERCAGAGADAVIIGAISFDGLNDTVAKLRDHGLPVIDVINGMSSPRITAKSLVSFGEMGAQAAHYIAARHPKTSEEVRAAWFPGPEGAGWVIAGDSGFRKALAGTSIRIIETQFGDTGKEAQRKLVDLALTRSRNLHYIVGTAVTAEVAREPIERFGLAGKVEIVAYYFTPGVFRGIRQGQVLAAPTDSPVIQARISVDQAVRVLEGKEYMAHVGPRLTMVDARNVGSFDRNSSLAPDSFRPMVAED